MVNFNMFRPRKRVLRTKHINIDVRKCRACGACLDACPNNVLGMISFLSHHHVQLLNPQDCSGCQRCLKTCKYEAIKPNISFSSTSKV